ncbi:MAG: Antibiotic biosynthesis monooxygenase [Amycolatopsis sp.]|uniref:antibiotic biosynthesis monooxygenase family protein n=1 Tax=Amycolatopsis sp. TaxID=37632 RepID=UPI00261D0C3D|nr:antibiotic biosynthesis monooxygenase [Amycolatopsis sp.]MCU1686722.1 Antibiotic biosynthesis monooxygenase [Amycolatopsis sp.]
MSTAESEFLAVGRVKVLLWCRYRDDEERREIVRRFDRIGDLLRGTPGLVSSELLISVSRSGGFAVLSEWASRAEFEAWERGDEHRLQTAGMRPFQDPGRNPPFDVLEVSRASDAAKTVTTQREPS